MPLCTLSRTLCTSALVPLSAQAIAFFEPLMIWGNFYGGVMDNVSCNNWRIMGEIGAIYT
jgi:hypothetical protein